MEENEKRKFKKWGDRVDARLVRDIDALQKITPYLFPNRCDNEGFITEEIDLTNLNEHIKLTSKSSNENAIFSYIVTAIVKVLTLQPQMNRFIQNKKLYQRDDLSIAFEVKKPIGEVADGGLIFLKFDKTANVDVVGEKISQEIEKAKIEKPDVGDKSLKSLSKLPRFVFGFMARIMNFLDVKGLLPRSVADADMNYASVFISNLGSTKLNSGYHHLTNRGTNSVFVVIGEEKLQAVYDDSGQVEMRKIIPLGITIDERIADEEYFSRAISTLENLLQHPEELDKPADGEIYLKKSN